MHDTVAILYGGAGRGAFQMGALRILVEHGCTPQHFDRIIGESIGATCAACFCANQIDDGCRALVSGALQRIMQPRNALPRHDRFGAHALRPLNLERFAALLQCDIGLRIDRLLDSFATRLDVTVTNSATAELEFLTVNTLENDEHVIRALMATKALVPLHDPIALDGASYIDGGLNCTTIVTEEMLDTAKHVVVFITVPRDHVFPPIPRWALWASFPRDPYMRAMLARVSGARTKALNHLVMLEQKGAVHLIAPDTSLVGRDRPMRTNFDARPEAQAATIAEGERIGRQCLKAIPT
jgi:predicted acylesterase/phospholipase RssA